MSKYKVMIDWKIKTVDINAKVNGKFPKEPVYHIPFDRLGESNWVNHLAFKGWLNIREIANLADAIICVLSNNKIKPEDHDSLHVWEGYIS